MLNREAIRHNMAPKDGDFGFVTSELEALLPAGTVDSSVKQVYDQVYIHIFITICIWMRTVIAANNRLFDWGNPSCHNGRRRWLVQGKDMHKLLKHSQINTLLRTCCW